MTKLFDDEGKHALTEAIKDIEARSSIEVVIAVRRSADAYRAFDLGIGIACATGALAFMLFSQFAFDTTALLLDPLVAGIAFTLFSAYAPWIKHFFIPVRMRRASVHRAALAAFLERGVHRTRGRTGVLVFLSLLEGMAEIVVDTGVEPHLDETERKALGAALERALPAKGIAVAKALRMLGDMVADRLPGLPDDVNELPDEVH